MKTFEEKRKEADSNFVSFEQKRSASSANNMADRLATFGRNAEEFYNEANKYGDFENTYEGNQSGAWYSNLSEWNNNFRREADSIKRNLGGYDTATAKRIADSLDKTLSQQNELLQRAGNIDSAWKEIGDEEGWQKWKADVANTRFLESFDYKKNKDIIDQMSKSGYQYEPVAFGKRIYTDPDQLTSSLEDKYGKDYVQAVFEHYGITDGDSARKAQTTLEQDRVNSDYMKLGKKYEDEIAAVNPTPATELDISELPNAFKIANDATFRNAFLAMDDTEKGFVKYLASTGRGDEIETFIYSLEQQKNNELANRVTSLITGIDNDFGRYLAELGMSVASGLSQAGEGIEGLGNLISGNDKYTATNALQNAGAQLVEYEASKYSWGKFHPAAVLLSATQTTANMLPSILVGTMLGGGAIVMGAGAAGNAYNEAINSGMQPSSAMLYSGMIGASETGLQYLLGGISSLGKGAGGAFEPLTEYMLGKVDNAIGRAAISLVGNGLSEATEEGLQEILEPWFKYITTGVKWDNANIDDVLYSSLLGFLSAGMLEGVPNLALTAVNEVNVAKIGNAIKENGMLGDVVEYVNTLPEEQRTKLAQNLTEDASGYKVGQTIRELGAGLSAQNVQTISGYLFELGLPQKEANTIAEGMAAVVNGEEASPELVSALDNPLVMSAWQSLFLQGERTTGQTVQTKDDFVNAVYRAVGVAKPITEKVDTTLGDRVRSNINAYEDIMRRTSSVNAVRNAAKAKDIADNIETSDIETTEQTPIESAKSADEYVGRAIDGLGFDTLSAQVLKDGINGTGINPITYAEGVREAALIGLNGIKDDSARAMMDNSSFAPLLPANIRDMAYRIGRAKYDASVEKADTTVREAVRQAVSKETPKAESKVTYDRSIDRKALNGSQKAQIAGVVQVSKAIGVDVEFYDSSKYGRKTEKGMSNGFFTGNKLYLDINAGTQQTILYTASHELTHFVKQWSPAKFETLKDFLFDFLTSEGYNAESFIKIEMEKAKAAGVKYSLADAIEDTVCEAMQMMLSSDNAIEKIAELSAKDKGLVDKIRKRLKKIIARIANALKGIDPTSESAKILQESYDAMQKLNTLFCEALVDAGENYSAVASAYGKDAVVEVNDDGEVLIVHGRTGTDAPIEHNLKTWKEGGRDRLAEYLSINGYSQNDIKRTLSVMDFYADAVYDYGNQYGLQKQINEMSVATDIKGEKTILSALIQNGDYPVNIDLTTICKKRQAMQKIVDRLCETGLIKSTVLNPETINQINKILGENALETACLGCFVESRRVNVQRWANEICNEWNKIVSGYNKKAPFFGFGDTTVRDMSDGDITKLTNELDKAHEEIGVNEEGVLKMGTGSVTRMETLLKNVPELRKFMRPGDLLTSEGRVNIKALPGGAELNSIIVGRYGSNTPKVVQGYNPYTNELLDYNKRDFVQYLFDIGGARAQSFSDFMVENWFDYMQIVADAYARQIPMHMYTKESALVELFGMTGIKINMSLIPDIDPTVDKDHAGLTKVNGKWQMIWADKDRFKATGGKSYMQSFNYRDAVRLQNDPRYSKNIGTITIGISDAQIRMALGDNNIRMVIPYHLSGMNPLFARLAGVSNYNDYTPFQNNNIIAIYDENGNKVDLKLTNSQKQNLKGGYEWNAKLQEIGDARATAQDYIAWCRDRNNHTVKIGGKTYYAEIAPKFSGWDNNGKYTEAKDFTNEKNYYKLLEDFNSYYFENGKEIAAPQGAVQMNFPDNFQKVLEEYLSNRQASMNKMGGRLDKAYRQIESYIKDEDFSRREKMLDMLDAKGRAELLKGRGRAMSIDEQVLEQNLLEKQFGLEQTELTKEKTRDLYSPERVNADGEGGAKFSMKESADVVELDNAKADWGININTDDANWTEMILNGKKTIETRSKNVFKNLLGRRIGLVETHRGQKAKLVGYATISDIITYETAEEFYADKNKHRVTPDSDYKWDGNKKYGYVLTNVERIDPRAVDTQGISKRKLDEGIKYSLKMVKAVKPTSNKWSPSHTTEEVRSLFPGLWSVDAEASETRNPTQVRVTTKSYRNIYNILKAEGFNGTILDASSGLGDGTRAGREEFGFKVDDIEPYPDSSYKPKYTDYSKLNKKYDVIISNAVLNVLPQEQRDALVVKMGELLNPGGRMFINVRGDDVLNASSKQFIDRDGMEVYISNTGSYQKGFTPTELKAYLEDALGDGYTVTLTKQFGKVSAIVQKAGVKTEDIRYSLKDSNGNQLTPAQAEYFKYSKVRDKDGNLLVVYHGTRSEMFNTFAKTDDIGYFFTDDESVAGTYSKTWSRDDIYAPPSIKTWQDLKRVAEDLDVGVVKTDNGYTIEWAYPGDVEYSENELDQAARDMLDEYEQHYGNNRNYEVYLNITDPLVINGDGSNWDEVYDYYDGLKTYDELTEAEKEAIADNLDMDVDEFEEEWQSETARRFNTDDMYPIYPQSTREWVMEAADGGYDGVIFKDIVDTAGYEVGFRPSDVYVVLNSNQIKSVNNADPTTNEDIRYSLKDSTGKQLTPAQAEYFKDSKVRDENGNLMVVYHGTDVGGFTIFDPKKSDDSLSLFFTNNRAMAQTYISHLPAREIDLTNAHPAMNVAVKSIEDAEMVMDESGYKFNKTVTGKYGQYSSYSVQDPLTKQVIYGMTKKEFMDYAKYVSKTGTRSTGLYKAYLNITNPLIVDAKGSNWNKIEFNGEQTSARGLAKYASENGYNGVLIHNLIDSGTGGHADVAYEPSEVAIAFDSNQIKLTTNENPTTNEDIRYQFKGENAQLRDDNLDVAKKMASEGVDNEKIRLATGWFKGMDGKWRYEIDDSKAKLIYKESIDKYAEDFERKIGDAIEERRKYDVHSKEYSDITRRLASLAAGKTNIGSNALLNLVDFLEHEELYKEYPYLKYRQVKFTDLPFGILGQTDGNSIALSNEIKGDDTKVIDTLLHEIQHVIQGYEGFAQGSNSAWWEARLPRNFIDSEYLNNLYRNDSKYQEMLADRKRFVEQLADADVNEKRLAATVFSEDSEKVATRFLDLVDQGVTEFDEPFAVFRDGRDAQNAGLLQVYAAAIANELDIRRYRRVLEQKALSEENSKRIQKAFDLYKNTKGEIEARDVSNRRTLTAEQRRQLPPDIYNPNAVDVDNYDSSALKYSLKDVENIDPVEIQPVNGVRDKGLYDYLAEDFKKNGWQGRPIVIVTNANNGYIALTGSHRIFAAQEAGIDVQAVVLEYSDEIAPLVEAYDDDERERIANELADEGIISREVADLIVRENELNFADYDKPYDQRSRFSLKSAEELSDRYYLSSALESATVNENEKNILKEYQAKVDQADALQEQLDNLNAEIHKYMFQKGRDTDKLTAMRNNAKTLGDKLDRIDKSLLKLERMSVLKDLATREKNKAVAKERARQKQFQSEMRENYRVKDYKRKIQKVVKDLNKLLNGTKDRNIKIPLQPTARNAIALAEQMFASTNRLDILYSLEGEGLEDYKALYDEYEALESKVTDEGRAMRSRLIEMSHEFDSMIDSEVERLNEVRSMSVRTAVSELANAYRSLQENENEYAKQAWDAGVQEYLNDLVTNMADVSVDKLTPAQFESIYKAFRMVYHTISVSNKLFRMGRSVSDLSRSVIDQVGEGRDFKAKVTQGRFNALNWVRSYSWSNLKPIYAFERIGSDDLTSLFWNVRSGEDVWAKDIQEAKLEAEMIREKYGWKNWDMNQRFDVKLKNGRVFPTTLGHLLSIVGYARREQALAHMSVGGFTYRESDLAKVGEWRNNKEGAQIGEEDLKTIANLLTNEQIQYAYEMQDYLSKMGAKGNEVSRQLYGIDLFGEDYYLPIKSSRESLSGQDTERNEAPSVASLKNKGFTKNVTPNARNKMELVQLDELWASHVNEMALYHGMVLPLTDLNRVLDFKESGSEEQGELSVKSAINQKFGSAATEYLAGFIRDVNGGVTTDRTANLFTKGLTKFKKTATMMSLSVVAQQYTAVARATALINPKYFAGKTDGMSHKQAYDELMQYAPIAFIKQLGGFDTGSGRTATEYLMDGSGQTKKQKVLSKIDEVGGIGAQYMDEVGWNTIWNAVKREVRETTDLTGEEFLKKCGERFTEVIVYTQVYDSTLARSALMRSKNAYVQMLTAFMGEPTTSINMLYNAILQRARGKWTTGQTARTIGATYTSIILAAAAASLVYAMRYDDDDEKSYAEIYGEKFGAKLRDELMPWNSLPFIRDIASLIEGWDVNREDVSVYGDLINDARRLFTEPTSEKALEFAGSFGNLFGVPASNIIRDTTGLWNLVERSATTSNHDLLEGFSRGWSGEKETKSERLFDVMQDKDQQGLDLIREEYASDKTFEQAQRDALRTNLVEVRAAAYKTVIGSSWLGEIDKAVSRGFDRNLVVAAVEAEARYIADQAKKAAEAFEEDKDKYKEIVSNFKKRYKDVFGSESKAQDFIISHMNRFRG